MDSRSPRYVMDRVASVSCGSEHALILGTDGSLLSCGSDWSGQLGTSRPLLETSPQRFLF